MPKPSSEPSSIPAASCADRQEISTDIKLSKCTIPQIGRKHVQSHQDNTVLKVADHCHSQGELKAIHKEDKKKKCTFCNKKAKKKFEYRACNQIHYLMLGSTNTNTHTHKESSMSNRGLGGGQFSKIEKI